MPDQTTTAALDLGFVYELTQGIRFGGTVDRLNSKRLWDVKERPQARVGVQLDIGRKATLSFEADVNAAQRMPFPVDQRTAAASLHIQATPNVTFVIGAEQKKIGDASVITGGASVKFRTASMVVGFGFQAGQDTPMKGLMARVN
jgi:hypothetical protein